MGKLQTTDILQLQMFLSEKKGTCILDFRLFAPSFKKKKERETLTLVQISAS